MKNYDVFVAGCTYDGGIYKYSLDFSGNMEFIQKTPIPDPMYLALSNNKLYALLRTPFGGYKSGLINFDIKDDSLEPSQVITYTLGKAACHFSIDSDGSIFLVNYLTGNVVKTDASGKILKVVCHAGKGLNEVRQDGPHTHFASFSPDGEYVCVCDLGLDTIFVYDKELNLVSKAASVPGSGPRHLVFNKKGDTCYCINELSNTVTVYDYCKGILKMRESYEMFSENVNSTAAAIRISNDDRFLYTSTRGYDKIISFEISPDGKQLAKIQETDCMGKDPRDFNITPDGKYMVVANQSGDVSLFEICKDGTIKFTGKTFSAPGALCVLIK